MKSLHESSSVLRKSNLSGAHDPSWKYTTATRISSRGSTIGDLRKTLLVLIVSTIVSSNWVGYGSARHHQIVCYNGGRCILNQCICPPGFHGRHCEFDVNECAEDNGGCSHFCQNIIGSYKCCCRPGFRLQEDGHTCVDVDECSTHNGGCSHTCTNTEGSYQCFCLRGYLRLDNWTCASSNYLRGCHISNGGCEHFCRPNPEGVKCSCRPGYILSEEGKECVSVDPCATYGCSQYCRAIDGVPRCSCKPRFILGEDSKTCSCKPGFRQTAGGTCVCLPGLRLDIDGECVCRPGAELSSDGTCTCKQGFILSSDGTCVCEPGSRVAANGTCVCKAGLTRTANGDCVCNPGFVLSPDGESCRCPIGFRESEDGKYCVCPRGYRPSRDGSYCEDIDECAERSSSCSHGCSNMVGSFRCECPQFYELDSDGKTCLRVQVTDYCAINNGGCEQLCQHTDVGARCYCLSGYSLAEDRKRCLDIDECFVTPGACHHQCNNTIGSYECTCIDGYSLSLDQYTCLDYDDYDDYSQVSNRGDQDLPSNNIPPTEPLLREEEPDDYLTEGSGSFGLTRRSQDRTYHEDEHSVVSGGNRLDGNILTINEDTVEEGRRTSHRRITDASRKQTFERRRHGGRRRPFRPGRGRARGRGRGRGETNAESDGLQYLDEDIYSRREGGWTGIESTVREQTRTSVVVTDCIRDSYDSHCPGRCSSEGRCVCSPGFTGINCQVPCTPGTFGENCEQICDCENGATCDRIDGLCLCPPGVTGARCEVGCPAGYYGSDCTKICPTDCPGNRCNMNYGFCECPPGRYGISCELKCPPMTYGHNCRHQCMCSPKGTVECNPVRGQCRCYDSYAGERCDRCAEGRWGAGCTRACRCPDNKPYCDEVDGSCYSEPCSPEHPENCGTRGRIRNNRADIPVELS